MQLKELGYETIIVNCNPETVSTDNDTSDKFYFEPVTTEDVLQIYEKKKPFGVIVQFSGRGMEVIYDEATLKEYVEKAVGVTPDRPLLIDRFLKNALECESDALADGKNVYIPSVMEHVELAGIHSGDSACVIPPVSIPEDNLKTIKA